MNPEELISPSGVPIGDADMQKLEAALRELHTLGDFEGHPFRGNQWTAKRIAEVLDEHRSNIKGSIAYDLEQQAKDVKEFGAGAEKWNRTVLEQWNVKTPEEYEAKVNKVLKETVAQANVFVRTNVGDLTNILKSGEVQNAFQSGRSHGGTTAGGSIDYARRSYVEEKLFGIPENASGDERPKYGYLSSGDGISELNPGILKGAGGVAIELKRGAIENRTTFTIGDSLDESVQLVPEGLGGGWVDKRPFIPQPILSPNFLAAPGGFIRSYVWRAPMPKHPRIEQLSKDYVEAQIHGKVSVADIKSVTFEKKPAASVVAKLKKLDIPYKIAKPRQVRHLGDVEGHPFHGNQWTDAQGASHVEQRVREEHPKTYNRASDVANIAEELLNGRSVNVKPHVAAPAIEHMAGRPKANLQHLQVEGDSNKNIFGPHVTELLRVQMPQLPEDKEGQLAFLAHLQKNGVEMKITDADPRELTATQAELDSSKVGQIYKYLLDHDGKFRGETGPLFVSKERDIIDGHHRWASGASYALTHPGMRVPIAVLNVPIERALQLSEEFSKKAGIAHEDFGAGFRQKAAAAGEEGFAPIDLTPPPPDAPPPPDDQHPWNWVNGRWIWIPTDGADGIPSKLNLPKVTILGDVEGHPFHGNQWTAGEFGLPDEEHDRGYYYHATKIDNLSAISQHGLVPQENDFGEVALSLSPDFQSALDWSSTVGLTDNAALLRIRDDHADAADVTSYTDVESVAHKVIPPEHLDVYYRGRWQPLKSIRTLGAVDGHPFYGNQWTSGKGASGLTDESTKREIHQKLLDLMGFEWGIPRGIGGGKTRVTITDTRLGMKAAVQVADVLTEMKDKGYAMPSAVHVRNDTERDDDEESPSGATLTTPTGTKELTIDIPSTLSPDADLDKAVRVGFNNPVEGSAALPPGLEKFTVNSLRDIIVHEMGHVNEKGSARYPFRYSGVNVARKVSNYATSNVHEFLAEAFTRLYRGEKLDDDVMKLYKRLGGPKIL